MIDLGPVRRWKEGDVIYAENDFVRMAYVVTDDPTKVGTLGWHGEGPKAVCVEYIATAPADTQSLS